MQTYGRIRGGVLAGALLSVTLRNQLRPGGMRSGQSQPTAFLSLLTVVRQESAAIVEWVEHHLVEGIEFIWVVDDSSTDRTVAALAPFTQGTYYATGLPGCGGRQRLARCYGPRVEVIPGSTPNRSHHASAYHSAAFEEAVLSATRHTRWLALLDTDEFLWATRMNETASQALAAIVDRGLADDPSRTVGQVMVNWRTMAGYHRRQPSCMAGAFRERRRDQPLRGRYFFRRVCPEVAHARGWSTNNFKGVFWTFGKPIALATAVEWLHPFARDLGETAVHVHWHPWKRRPGQRSSSGQPVSNSSSKRPSMCHESRDPARYQSDQYRTVEADGSRRRSLYPLGTPYDRADLDSVTGFRLAINHYKFRSYEWYHSVKACRGHVNDPLSNNNKSASSLPPSGYAADQWLRRILGACVPSRQLANKRALMATAPDAWKYSHCKIWDGTTVDIDRPCAVISSEVLDDTQTDQASSGNSTALGMKRRKTYTPRGL